MITNDFTVLDIWSLCFLLSGVECINQSMVSNNIHVEKKLQHTLLFKPMDLRWTDDDPEDPHWFKKNVSKTCISNPNYIYIYISFTY